MGIDTTYQRLLRTFPADLQEYAGTLPHRLGLAESAAGRWVDFVTLEPNRELPLLIADELAGEGREMPRSCLRAFREAHHIGGCAMMAADRLADLQVRAEPRMIAVRRILLRAWCDRLGEAMGSRENAQQLIDRFLVQWKAGVTLERLMLKGRRGWKAYAKSARLKLQWVCGTTCAMLDGLGLHQRAEALAEGYTCFLFALQCRDDVSDTIEDARVRGVSLPAAIGVSPGALVRAAPLFGMRAAEFMHLAKFPRLGSWMDDYSRPLNGFLTGENPVYDQIVGMSIARSFDELTNYRSTFASL